jgi:hypothetical protein
MKKNSIVLLLILAGLTTTAGFSQTVFPYLSSVTPNSIYVTWKTSSNTQTLVQYGTSPGVYTNNVNGTNAIWSDAGYPNNYYYHTAKLTGLNPNTEYYYKVTSGSFTSTESSFRTLPLPGNAATPSGHIRFLVFGDNQIKTQPRFDTLMCQAKRKCIELYGPDINNNIAGILMVGDQVDVGTLDHYENVHFAKSKYLSPSLSISTVVGNHETYGSLGMSAYYNHFYYDSLAYQGLYSGNEGYYAYQAGNVLFINMNTESTTAAQFTWVQNVVTAANADPTVKWIISLAHRPYQAEQYVGDISTWIRTTVVPYLSTSPKYVMHFGAHHHLYARGQLKNNPVYHLISGGTAWDQYWGMGTEQDFDDVQKTISRWGYQIIDIDVVNNTMDVETYSCGSIYHWTNNQLIDKFHRKLGLANPNTPLITNAFADSVALPYTVTSSAFGSSAGELLNTTQFQISQTILFSTTEEDILRDYENLYGPAGSPDTSIDMNNGVNILAYTINAGQIPNGKHYVRVRHRDRNLNWSSWSPADSFVVYGSVLSNPILELDQTSYELTDTIHASYSNGPGLATDWIGIYQVGQVPGGPPSTVWSYVSGVSGVEDFQLSTAGQYFAAFFTNDGYTEIAPRVYFYAGPIPDITTDTNIYDLTDTVHVSYTNAPGFTNDWVGVYKVGMVPGVDASVQWQYTAGGTSGTLNFTGLPQAYYFANYFLEDGYTEPGERTYFQVGDTITQLFIDQSIYNLGEYITATWTDGPGTPKDWLGIFDSTANPQVDPLTSYTYVDGLPAGTQVLQDTSLPSVPGSYFISLFINDSYTEVSNRCYFRIIDTNQTASLPGPIDGSHPVKLFPNPTTGDATIECVYPIEKLELLNSSGQVVFRSRNVNDQHFTLLSQQLPPGVYYIRIYTRMTYTLKLIIEKQ